MTRSKQRKSITRERSPFSPPPITFERSVSRVMETRKSIIELLLYHYRIYTLTWRERTRKNNFLSFKVSSWKVPDTDGEVVPCAVPTNKPSANDPNRTHLKPRKHLAPFRHLLLLPPGFFFYSSSKNTK